jgi:hypothetical protein
MTAFIPLSKQNCTGSKLNASLLDATPASAPASPPAHANAVPAINQLNVIAIFRILSLPLREQFAAIQVR